MPAAIARTILLAAALAAVTLAACRGADAPGSSRAAGDPNTPNAAPAANATADRMSGYGATIPVVRLELGGRRVSKDDETAAVLKVMEDEKVALESGVTLQHHGNSSGTLAKKSYRVEFVDSQGQDRELPFLGLPAGSDWLLHNCGFDPICVRNPLVYDLAETMGHYAPRARVLELFVDGKYEGLYMLLERVRRDRHRVDLPRPSESRQAGDITGGYIFRMNLGEGAPGDDPPRDWVSPVSHTVYSYLYPRFDRITDDQKAYLHGHVAGFETMMRGARWNDATEGYQRWLDMRSWVDFALIQELALNPDAYFKSVYLQKWPQARGGKIAIGPLWDFDLSFGIAEFRDARNVESWAHDMNRFGGEPVPHDPARSPYVPEFWVKLWTDPSFHQALQCRWRELRGGPLHLPTMQRRIDDWVVRLKAAFIRDAARWPHLPKNAWSGGADAIKTFLERRIAWMDAELPGACDALGPPR